MKEVLRQKSELYSADCVQKCHFLMSYLSRSTHLKDDVFSENIDFFKSLFILDPVPFNLLQGISYPIFANQWDSLEICIIPKTVWSCACCPFAL